MPPNPDLNWTPVHHRFAPIPSPSSMTRIKRTFLIGLSFCLLSCAKGFETASEELSSSSSQGDLNSPPPTIPVNPPINPPIEPSFEPLAWEKARPEGKAWSAFVFDLLKKNAHDILTAQDMNRFCKKYSFLSDAQKINVAGQLVAGIVKFESGFNPLSRMQETTMGTDPITGLPVWSEGLMQLSYQDVMGWPFCDFKWDQDKKLNPKDPKKTILDPYKNLHCGMRILAQQVKRKGFIVLSSGVYWAVIKENGRYEKIDEIAEIVGSLKICQ